MNRRRLAARIVAASLASVGALVLEHDHSTPGLLSEGLVARPHPSRPWTVVGGRHWQLQATGAAEAVDAGDDTEEARGACPAGMVEVRGQMRVDGHPGTVEELQDTTCVDWITREFPARCATFDAAAWRRISASLPTRPMHFCIDAYEYPNRKGENPIIGVTWYEAVALCQERAGRLCSEDEWTFACEGDEALPYPYGYWRDEQACVIDRPWRPYDAEALARRDSAAAIREIDYLWQGEASGARPGCRSPFGVRDMTGNVDEWTVSVLREGLRSILKGGYWGPVRARCRASTRVHNEDFFFYQQGFRCCAEAPQADSGEPENDAGG
jgi:formylglycine-generating enzyme required for sulfatase activity